MKKFSLFLLSAALMATFAVPAWSLELKIATVAPEGSSWMLEMRKGAAEIKERSQGRVSIKFYGGGVMGNEKSVLRKIRIGQLHGGAFTGGGLAEAYPDIQLYSLLLNFRGLDEIDYVRRRMDPILREGLEKAGFVSFGLAEGGFAQMIGNVPVRSLEEMKGKKFWIPEGDLISYAVAEALGLSPVTLPITDVMTGLQTGLLDVVAGSPIGAIAFQWHTKLRYLTSTPVAYVFATMAIDKKIFQRLSAEDQGLVREVMERIYLQFDQQNRPDNESALQALITQGIEIVNPAPAEETRWRDIAAKVNDRLGREGRITPALYNQMQDDLNRFRQGSAAEK
ncbi:MAG: TRAP transporter substrate-binding protein DctP [Desulfuromonadales bacterium]